MTQPERKIYAINPNIFNASQRPPNASITPATATGNLAQTNQVSSLPLQSHMNSNARSALSTPTVSPQTQQPNNNPQNNPNPVPSVSPFLVMPSANPNSKQPQPKHQKSVMNLFGQKPAPTQPTTANQVTNGQASRPEGIFLKKTGKGQNIIFNKPTQVSNSNQPNASQVPKNSANNPFSNINLPASGNLLSNKPASNNVIFGNKPATINNANNQNVNTNSNNQQSATGTSTNGQKNTQNQVSSPLQQQTIIQDENCALRNSQLVHSGGILIKSKPALFSQQSNLSSQLEQIENPILLLSENQFIQFIQDKVQNSHQSLCSTIRGTRQGIKQFGQTQSFVKKLSQKNCQHSHQDILKSIQDIQKMQHDIHNQLQGYHHFLGNQNQIDDLVQAYQQCECLEQYYMKYFSNESQENEANGDLIAVFSSLDAVMNEIHQMDANLDEIIHQLHN